MFTPIKKYVLLPLFVLAGLATSLHGQGLLDGYVREGLSSNLVLKEKQLGLQRGLLGLQNAKRLFLPAVNLSGTYTLAQGGRSISLPVGDLMNPVYATLNQLTQSNAFPQIENVEEQFLPNNFYDLKVRTTMPLINSDLIRNRNIQTMSAEMQQFEVEAYQLELVKEIRTAYYRYLMAIEARSIFESAEGLVVQNLRVNRSLLENGKGLPAQVLRAESELENIRSQRSGADANVANAQAYLNFLLNRSTDTPLETEVLTLPDNLDTQLNDAAGGAQRPELGRLDIAHAVSAEALKMEQQYWVPRLSAFVDLGSQAFDFEFGGKSLYAMAGLQLDVPLWNGGRDHTDIALREQGLRELENKRQQAVQGIALATQTRRNSTLAAFVAWKSALRQTEAAEAYFRLVEKGYAQGAYSLIEQIDARNQVTQARLLANIRKYETFIGLAEYQREIAQSFE
jgi:outer membrane protein